MIKVTNLTRNYGSLTAVNSVSFEIPKGQIVGLLGHNGAGKTTTLKMLTGYLEASSGNIDIDGMNLAENRLEIQAKIGYLPENSPLYPEMSVVEYLDYVARLRGISEAEIPGAIEDAIKATDLKDKALASISTLSKGYRQRVGVAQAIIHKPEILVLDEPTNGLDPTQILAMRDLIKSLGKIATVIISTHIMQEVEAICDRVLIILGGRLAEDALISDLQKGATINLGLKQELQEVRSVVGGIKGVRSVNQVRSEHGYNHFDLEIEDNAGDVSPVVAKAVVEKGWPLFSIGRQHRNLETVFKDVNRVSKGGAHV